MESDTVVSSAAPLAVADQTMAQVAAVADQTMAQAPGLTDAVPKKQRAEKRPAADAMSPGHLASTTALAPAERRLQHAHMGVDKDFRDAVKTERSTMELTKDVLELQHVMKQAIQVINDLQKNDFDQEARMVLAVQRVEGIDPAIHALENMDV